MEKHYMIDIETTGVNQETDDILQVALVEIEFQYPYWYPTGRSFQSLIHSTRQPENEFAKKYMAPLYKACNEASPELTNANVGGKVRQFIHTKLVQKEVSGPSGLTWVEDMEEVSVKPQFFMGRNASNFDMPFMFKKGLLTPSYYEKVGDKEELRGDAHYRIYEQTGSVNLMVNITGLKNDTVKKLAEDFNPTNLQLPKGKAHDALYDCYYQILLMNGLIAIGRKGLHR